MLAWLERNQFLVAGLGILLLVSGVAVSRVSHHGEGAPIVFRNDSGLADGSPIRVHVAGAVVSPGVYALHEGDRLNEALSSAGGPTDIADLDQVNLARRLWDEEQVLVPTRTAARVAATALPAGTKLDLNAATEAQLDSLPGIGEAYARRIIDSRKVDGPYRTPQDLVDRRVLPRAAFDKIRDLLTVAAP